MHGAATSRRPGAERRRAGADGYGGRSGPQPGRPDGHRQRPARRERDQPVGIAGAGGRVDPRACRRRQLGSCGAGAGGGRPLGPGAAGRAAGRPDRGREGAKAALAQADYDRALALQGRGFISKAEIDAKKASRDAAYRPGPGGAGPARRDARADRPAERGRTLCGPDPFANRRARPDRQPRVRRPLPPGRRRPDGNAAHSFPSRTSPSSTSACPRR